MLDLEDERWPELLGGRRTPFDPRPALARLSAGEDVAAAWNELWQGLHHRGSVDLASYAVVPHLVRIHGEREVADANTYALAGTIELLRGVPPNPTLAPWLVAAYVRAWDELVELALADLRATHDGDTVRAILGVLALARRQRSAAELLLGLGAEDLDELLALWRRGS